MDPVPKVPRVLRITRIALQGAGSFCRGPVPLRTELGLVTPCLLLGCADGRRHAGRHGEVCSRRRDIQLTVAGGPLLPVFPSPLLSLITAVHSSSCDLNVRYQRASFREPKVPGCTVADEGDSPCMEVAPEGQPGLWERLRGASGRTPQDVLNTPFFSGPSSDEV